MLESFPTPSNHSQVYLIYLWREPFDEPSASPFDVLTTLAIFPYRTIPTASESQAGINFVVLQSRSSYSNSKYREVS